MPTPAPRQAETAKVAVVQLVDNDAFTEMIDSLENKC